MEKINELFSADDLKVYQDSEGFNFSLDSVLLAKFASLKKNSRQILDIGTGNAAVALLLSKRTSAPIIGVEIQPEVAVLAQKSVAINNLETQIKIKAEDIKDFVQFQESDSFETIVCNPPFFRTTESSRLSQSKKKQFARHEISLDLETVFRVAKKLLVNQGNIAIVNRPERLVEIINCMQVDNITPKRMQIVFPKENKKANVLLIEGTKNGKAGLIIEPPLIIHKADGSYTEAAKDFFRS